MTDRGNATVTLVAPNGQRVSVAGIKRDDRLRAGYRLPNEADATTSRTDAEGYDGLKVADLRAEVEKRNADRADHALIPTDGKKAELVAALEADDAARSGN